MEYVCLIHCFAWELQQQMREEYHRLRAVDWFCVRIEGGQEEMGKNNVSASKILDVDQQYWTLQLKSIF